MPVTGVRRLALRTRLLVPALAACLALAGCSSDGADAAEAVRGAPDKTIEAGSARAALSLSFTTGGVPTTVRGDGVFDLRNRRGGLTLDLGSLSGAFGGGAVDAVLSPEGIFVKLPSAPGGAGGRPWLKISLATLSEQAGLNLGSLAQLQQSDPTQALTYLKGALDDVDEVGEDTLRGVETTHYRGTIDLRRATASLPPEAQAAVEDAIASLGTSRIPADVWLDDDGRIRQLRITADPDGEGPNGPGTLAVELYDFGATADVQVPPADQVADLTDLFGTGRR